jgi:hypothetical protein
VLDGFLMLGRSVFRHALWREDRVFSRAEAWLDLLQSAAIAPGDRLIAGHVVGIPRGGIVASVRFLSDRWKWSNTTVCLFLDLLQGERMITREKRQGVTVISLCNYDKYNPPKRQRGDGGTTPGRQRDDEVIEGENPKEGEDGAPPAAPPAVAPQPPVPLDAASVPPPAAPPMPLPGLRPAAAGAAAQRTKKRGLPAELAAMAGFAAEWEEFRRHRRTKRAPMTPRAEQLILTTLAERPHLAVRAVQEAIQANWNGFHWDWLERRCPRLFVAGGKASAQKAEAHTDRITARLPEWQAWLAANYDPGLAAKMQDPRNAPESVREDFLREGGGQNEGRVSGRESVQKFSSKNFQFH